MTGTVARQQAAVRAGLSAGPFRASAVVRGAGWELGIAPADEVPAASLAKLPLLAALALAFEAGALAAGERVPVRTDVLAGGAGVLTHLHPDQAWRLDDLAVLMIAVSDNTAANVLLGRLGAAHVEQVARELGMRSTTVRTPFGALSGSAATGNRTTAADVAHLLRGVMAGAGMSAPAAARGTAGADVPAAAAAWMRRVLSAQQLRTKLGAGLPWDAPPGTLAHKTGELPGVEHDAGILRCGARSVVLAVCLTEVADRARARQAITDTAAAVYASLCADAHEAIDEVR